MGYFYHFICKCLNILLEFLGEPLINPDKSKMKVDYPKTWLNRKDVSSPFVFFKKKNKNSLPLDNVLFINNLITLENAFVRYSNVFFLKANKLYNKGRYSRNKQAYRTGVIWCLWLTVVAIAGPFYYFYSFTFKFTYLWLLFFIFITKFVYNYAVKHNYINSWKLFYYVASLFKNNI
jgi:hypothetical protein